EETGPGAGPPIGSESGPRARARCRPGPPPSGARPRRGPHHDARRSRAAARERALMRVLGMMSGTSLDAIDVVLAEFDCDPEDPATLRARLLHVGEEPWPAATRDALRAVLPP